MVSVAELLNYTYNTVTDSDELGQRRQPLYVFSKKKFGSVYAGNKFVKFKPDDNIIEISMIISKATEKNRTAHRVALALKDIDIEVLSLKDAIRRLRVSGVYTKHTSDISMGIKLLTGIRQKWKGKWYWFMAAEDKEDTVYQIPMGIPLTNVDIAVNCTCSDFLYTFAWYCADYKCLIGRRPAKYTKFTGLTNKEAKEVKTIRNLRRYPGVCKHCMLLLALLMKEEGILQKEMEVMDGYRFFDTDVLLSRKRIEEVMKAMEKELRIHNKQQNALRREISALNKEASKKRGGN